MVNKKNILLVEDSKVAAMAAKLILENLGCQVEHALDGDKAVQLVKEKQYDAVCMDIGLPTISGITACMAIREYEIENKLAPIPIVAVSGNNSDEEVKTYLKAGMQGVIMKPLTIEKAKNFLSFFIHGLFNSMSRN